MFLDFNSNRVDINNILIFQIWWIYRFKGNSMFVHNPIVAVETLLVALRSRPKPRVRSSRFHNRYMLLPPTR